jgi:hypothetical protein
MQVSPALAVYLVCIRRDAAVLGLDVRDGRR